MDGSQQDARSAAWSPARRSSRFAWWLIVLTLAGFTLRVVYLLSQQDLAVGGDGFHFLNSARLADRGQWFEFPFGGGPDAHHPPLWTALLSLVSISGANGRLTFQLFAVVVGSSSIALVGLAGRKIVDQRVGLAATLAALYPGLWRYERELLSEVVLVPLVALRRAVGSRKAY